MRRTKIPHETPYEGNPVMALPVDDILAIQKLIADYNFAVDAGDGDAFAQLFVDDGSLDSGFGVTKGRAELRDFASAVPTMVPGGRHIATNLSVEGDGDGATARMYLQMFSTNGGSAETKLIISGRYDDTLRREGGQWRFVERRMQPDS